MTKPIRPVPLPELIAQRIQTLILEGILRPGERLMPERELAERLGVSRPSLRQALAVLERKGLLVAGKSGTAVAKFLSQLTDPLAELLAEDERAAASLRHATIRRLHVARRRTGSDERSRRSSGVQ